MLDKTFYHTDPKRSMIFHNSENSPKPKISFFRDTLYLSTRPCKVWRCIGLGTVNSSLWEASVGRDISEGWGSSIVALLWIGQKKCEYQYFLLCIFISIVRLWILQNCFVCPVIFSGQTSILYVNTSQYNLHFNRRKHLRAQNMYSLVNKNIEMQQFLDF